MRVVCFLLHIVEENVTNLFEFWVAVLCCFVLWVRMVGLCRTLCMGTKVDAFLEAGVCTLWAQHRVDSLKSDCLPGSLPLFQKPGLIWLIAPLHVGEGQC